MAFLLRITLAAAAAEFLLLRLLLRLGPVLPENEGVTRMLTWATKAGLLSLNVAVMAGLATLAALALSRDEERAAPWPLTLAALLALALGLTGLVYPALAHEQPGPAFLALLSAAAMALLGLAALGAVAAGGLRLPLAAALAAGGTGSYHYLARASGALGTPLPAGGLSLATAESLALVVAPALLATLRPGWTPWAALAATAASVAYLGAALAQPWMANALAIWDLGFTGFLPPYVYTAALWLFAYTALALMSRKGTHLAGLGLALLAPGGLRLEYSYYSLLFFAGLLALAAYAITTRPAASRVVLEKSLTENLAVGVLRLGSAGEATTR